MVFKTDEDMSLDKYWEKHCISIAKDRRWAIQKGDQYSFENCATLRQYDDYIKKVASYQQKATAFCCALLAGDMAEPPDATVYYSTIKQYLRIYTNCTYLCRYIW